MNNDYQYTQSFNTQNFQFNQVPNKKINNKQLGLIIGGAATLIIVIGLLCYYFLSLNNPTNFYRGLVRKSINEVFDIVYQDDKKINASVDLGVKLKLEDGLIDESLVDLVNKTKIKLNYQMDKEKEQILMKLDSDYDKDSLLDVELFIDNKNEETYLYAKDYFDKYLEVEMDDYSSFSEMFEEGELTFGQEVNSKKAKKIITEELTKVITSEDCSKEDGSYVFEITEEELIERLTEALKNLKDNDKFLECYEDEDAVKEALQSLIDTYEDSEYTDEVFKISIDKTFTNKIEKAVVEYQEIKMTATVDNDTTYYEVLSDNEKVLEGYIKNTKNKDNNDTELSLKIPELGSVVINLDTSYVTGKDIDKVDISGAKSMDELTEEEQTEIMTNIQESKLFELIETFSGSFGGDDFEDDYYYEEDDFDYSDVTIGSDDYELYSYDESDVVSLNIPSDYESTYSSDTYKVFEKDDIEVGFRISFYDDEDEYLESLDSMLEYTEDDESYKNVKLSDKKSKTVNGRTYYYRDYTYDYDFIGTTTYNEKYLCTKISENNYLIVEVSAIDSEISESDLNTFLSID